MSIHEDLWTNRLHAAVDEHPGALAFDVGSYVAAGRRRVRRNRVAPLAATIAAVAVVVTVAALGTRGGGPQPVAPIGPEIPLQAPAANGWIAIDAAGGGGGGDIYLVRPGEEARRLEVAGSDTTNEACPAWSPDGTRLLFGRVTGTPDTTVSDAELVIVPVSRDGAPGTPTVIELDGFGALDGFEPHPCGTWAPDGRWIALRGPGDVWVIDTQTQEVRRLPDLRPIDLEWRPGTDELAIAGDMGTTRASNWAAAPVTIYSVSTGELQQLDSVVAAHLTWSPSGSTLAYEDAADKAGLWLVDADGANARVLVADTDMALHGIGPLWSPEGDRIAYQRQYPRSSEGSEVVLVSVADGAERVIEPPRTGGTGATGWFPYRVAWSPDGTTLLYTAWANNEGVIAVRADAPEDVTIVTDLDPVPGYKDHAWVTAQMWGRQPK